MHTAAQAAPASHPARTVGRPVHAEIDAADPDKDHGEYRDGKHEDLEFSLGQRSRHQDAEREIGHGSHHRVAGGEAGGVHERTVRGRDRAATGVRKIP